MRWIRLTKNPTVSSAGISALRKPITSFGGPLYLSQTNTWANFQALTSWRQPFNNYNSSVTNATPADGMLYASSTYDSTYFELYVADVDYSGYRADFEMWRARLFPPNQVSIALVNPGGLHLQWPSWPGGHYQVVRSSDLRTWTNAGTAVVATTNLTTWAESQSPLKQFYRLRTLP